MPLQTRKHGRSPLLVEHIGTLQHSSTFQYYAPWIRFQQTAAHKIMTAIDGTQFVAVQPRAIAGKSNEIPQAPLLRNRFLAVATRLIKMLSQGVVASIRTYKRQINSSRS